MSSIQPKKQDLDGVEYLSANESTNIKISGDDSSSNGARIELGKDLTTTPIISHLSGDGFDFGVLGNFTFPQMVLAKEKLQAVVTPLPATDTLKVNKKVLLDDGAGNTGTLDINGTDLEISSSGNIHLNPTGAIGIGGANYGTSGQVLTSNGASAPTWTTLTSIPFPSWTTFTAVVLQPATSLATNYNDCAYLVNGSMVTARYNIRMNDTGTLGNTIRVSLPITTSKYAGIISVAQNCIGSVAFYDPNQQYDSYYSYSLTANINGGVGATQFFIGGENKFGGSWFGQFPQVNIVPNSFISATITYEI